jgi:hypothetical protein
MAASLKERTAGDWQVAPLPQWKAGEAKSGNWGGSAFVVTKQSKFPKAVFCPYLLPLFSLAGIGKAGSPRAQRKDRHSMGRSGCGDRQKTPLNPYLRFVSVLSILGRWQIGDNPH